MLETGIGRAANLALAAMPGFTLPGDTSASKRYFTQDVTTPFELHSELSVQLAAKLNREGRAERPSQIRDGSATVARAYRLLRSIFSTAVNDELLPRNPCKIKGAGVAKAAGNPNLTLPEVQQLAEAVPDRYRALVHLLVWSGVRIGEAAALRRRDLQVSGNHPTLTVRERVYKVQGQYEFDSPKSEAGARTIALPPHIAPILQEHLDTFTGNDQDALVFTTQSGAIMLNAVEQSLRRYLDRIGRNDIRVHDLRHMGMTLAAESGASLPELKHRLGQSTTAAAAGYLHATQDHGRRVAERMSELADSQNNVVPLRRAKGI